jgi:predicted choloylglycine hydrolase
MTAHSPLRRRIEARPGRAGVAALVFVAVAAVSVLPSLSALAEPTDRVTPKLLGEQGPARLWQVGEQRVLLLSGSPYEMGLQQGRLLAAEIRECVRLFLDFALSRDGNTRETFAAIWKAAETDIPQRYKDELRGLAEGSGASLTDLQLLHVIPEKYHCSGAAAFGPATKDGKLYHTRSLDYAIDIGNREKTAQENALLVVYRPEEGAGFAHANVAWAGFIGSITGMNAKGVSIGEMGSSSKNETFEGIPMIFMVREILHGADGVESAVEITRRCRRTAGYNFIYGDGKKPTAAAIEVNKDAVKVFPAGGSEENVAPHFAIAHCVRRCNHFVDPELSKLQREGYDPRFSSPGSWLGYHLISEYLVKQAGRLDAEAMIALLRGYPPDAPCLHQAVFAPGDREIYVAVAKNPHKVRRPGAQNQVFYRYRLDRILASDPGPVELYAPSSAQPPAEKPAPAPGAAPPGAGRR